MMVPYTDLERTKNMALQILSDPFKSNAGISLSEAGIREAAPALPDTKVQDLIRAAENEEFDKQEGINEKFVLDKRLSAIASTLSAELGPFALDAYEQAQGIISAAALKTINEGDRTGSFRGANARGGSQWDVQQILPQAFSSGTISGTASVPTRVQSTGVSDDSFDIIPYEGGGSSGSETYTPSSNTQSMIILGYFSTTNPRVVDHVQLGVDDGESRNSEDVYVRSNLGTLQAFNSGSVEYITDDDSIDLNGYATQNADTDIFPFGVNFDTAANLPSLSVQN